MRLCYIISNKFWIDKVKFTLLNVLQCDDWLYNYVYMYGDGT